MEDRRCVKSVQRKSPTAWKVSIFGVIMVRVLTHSDWIRRDAVGKCGKMGTRIAPNTNNFCTLNVLSRNAEKYALEILQILALFMQCPYSARMRKNKGQKNSEYGHFMRSPKHCYNHGHNILRPFDTLPNFPSLSLPTKLKFFLY